ncbi:MAG TPA: GAF domain-containing sensor histidine kinase [Actinomycetota bacterium]
MEASARSRTGGRQAAVFLVASGVLTVVNDYLPGAELLNRAVLNSIGIAAISIGLIAWFTPWERWHPRASLVLAAAALALIATANYLGGVSAYSYAVYFVVLFVWIGTAHTPWTSLAVAPFATVAYVSPFIISEAADARALSSATVAIPVCVLVGETVARIMRRVRIAQRESDRRASLLQTVAGSARSLNVLDPRAVIEGVVDAALALGFDAAEICDFDQAGGYRVMHARGLPDAYVHGVHPPGSGLAALVRARGETVVIDDYASFAGGVPVIREGGFRVVVGSPIFSGGAVVAALIAGTHASEGPADHAEAFALLSAQAGRALENAERFSAERRAVERLAELDRLKDEFIATASHELRTPVTVIEGMGKTLTRKWDALDEQTRLELLDRMNMNAGRLAQIVNSLLDFSRIESGGKADLQPVALRALVDECVARLEGILVAHPVEMHIDARLRVQADPMLLDRTMENLLANAAKHTPAGTRVGVDARATADGVVISVADDGPGIDAADLPRLGERFFRGRPPLGQWVPGTGLGLAFVHQALALHGSRLHVECPPDGGSIFSFRLPRATRRPERRPSQPAAQQNGRVTKAG